MATILGNGTVQRVTAVAVLFRTAAGAHCWVPIAAIDPSSVATLGATGSIAVRDDYAAGTHAYLAPELNRSGERFTAGRATYSQQGKAWRLQADWDSSLFAVGKTQMDALAKLNSRLST